MKNLQPYENYGTSEIQENLDMQKESSCMSESAKMQLEKLCEEYLANEAAEYHEDENEEIRNSYKSIIEDISSNLKTLKRSERLNNILEL